MNAKRTLETLKRELKREYNNLQEESSPRKFRLIPNKGYNESSEYYYNVIYPYYKKHNDEQQEKINLLTKKIYRINSEIQRIKKINFLKRLFIA